VDFIIVAFAIFSMIKAMNMLRKKEAEQPAEAPPPSEDIVLLREIRDSLKK
jgi:large conductance mechanosensitive channel